MSKEKVTYRIETITPQLAERYLEKNLKKNRGLTMRHVDKLLAQMKKGAWDLNGESIKFARPNGDGVEQLIDGQHRLFALTKAKRSIDFLVVRGLDPDVFMSVDSGRNRGAHDILKIYGEGQPTLLAAALRMLYTYRIDPAFTYSKRSAITTREIIDLYAQHPEIKNSLNLGHKTKYMVPGSKLVFLHYVLSRNPDNQVGDFMLKLTQGIGMLSGDPVLTFREKLLSLKSKNFRLRDRALIGMLFKTWNYSHYNERITKLQYTDDEVFPLLAGVDFKKLFGIDYPEPIIAKVKSKGSSKQKRLFIDDEDLKNGPA